MGSIGSLGVNAVSKCDTEELPCCGDGANMRTWSLTRPAVRTSLAAATSGPTHCRFQVLVLATTRSALLIAGYSLPVL
jgi:hypothetical protein